MQMPESIHESLVYTERPSYVTTNRMLKNTYLLLSMTILFSAVCAWIGVVMRLQSPIIFLIAGFAALFIALKQANSASGLFWVFVFTGIEGLSLGPILNLYLGTANGGMLIMQAFGLTTLIFASLSFYAITTKKDFSFLRGFILTGLIIVIAASLLSFFVPSIGGLWISGAVALIMTAAILFDTSRIVNGGETNYIRATISLYLDFLNLFLALLRILGSSRD